MSATARATPRADATRVAVVQRQARQALRLAVAFGGAAAIAAIVPHATGAWLPLHLLLAGGVVLAISGVAPMLTVTWSAAPPPPPRVAAAQRWLVALGAATVAVGREASWPAAIVGAGGTLLLLGLAVLAATIVVAVRHGVQRRFDAAARGYALAIACGFGGGALGVLMATGHAGDAYARARDAHVTLNLLGLVGTTIAATAPFFVATEARVKLSPRYAVPAGDRAAGVLVTGTALAAVGFLGDWPAAVTAGLVLHLAGLALTVGLLPGWGRKQLGWAGPRLLQLHAGLAWWAGAVAVVLATGEWAERTVAVLALGGWAQIVVASLAYLGPVLRGGGHERLAAGFRTTRSWLGLAAGNLTAASIAAGAGSAAMVVAAVWFADTAVRGLLLARRR